MRSSRIVDPQYKERIAILKERAQSTPDAPASELFSEIECRVLILRCAKKNSPPVPLTVLQAVLWVGRLGGHLNRRLDGIPGAITLSRGIDTLKFSVLGYESAMAEHEKRKQAEE